jgi:hypothetical protein
MNEDPQIVRMTSESESVFSAHVEDGELVIDECRNFTLDDLTYILPHWAKEAIGVKEG